MPLEALLIPDNLTDSDSDGIDGGTGCNFILLCRLLVVGPVLKWLALCICVFIYIFLRAHSPGHTFGYFWLKISYVGFELL